MKDYEELITRNKVECESGFPLDLSTMSSKEISEELEKGYSDMLEGRVKSSKEVFEKFHRKIGA